MSDTHKITVYPDEQYGGTSKVLTAPGHDQDYYYLYSTPINSLKVAAGNWQIYDLYNINGAPLGSFSAGQNAPALSYGLTDYYVKPV